MGCAQSRIENEEAVSRCKDRRNFMKEAVSERNAFAAAHSAYAVALKNTGAALSDYAHGEVVSSTDLNELHRHSVDGGGDGDGPGSAAGMDANALPPPPPPPPPPSFSPSPILQRSVTMPEFHQKPNRKNLKPIAMTIPEDEGGAEGESGGGEGGIGLQRKSRRNGVGERTPGTPLPPPSPPLTPPITPAPPAPPELKGVAWDYFFMVDNMGGGSLDEGEEGEDENDENEENEEEGFEDGKGKVGGWIDEGFEPKTPDAVLEKIEETPPPLKKEVAHIAHSQTAPPEFIGRRNAVPSVNLLKVLGVLDDHFLKASESAQEVSKILEANRLHYHSNFADNRGHIDHSARVMRVITWNRSFKGNGGLEDLDSEEYETHATILDKILAWEKKLYDEVKTGELMKLEYRRKIALLNKQKKRGVSTESLEKTKAAVSHLHTRYIVDMQSLDSTVAEVNHLRDDQLYPKLASLVDEMAKMWGNMCLHHNSQLKVVAELKSLDVSQAPKETTKQHQEQTIQLWKVVQDWHLQFEKLVTHQKQYIRALNSWLKFNLIPIECSLKEKISSPPKSPNPPIQILLLTWHDYLEKLPDELAKSAISSFAAVIKTIIDHQEEEMKLKEKCEETRKEYMRKNQAFEEWYQKHMSRRAHDEMDPDKGGDDANSNPVLEKQVAVESLKKRLGEEVEDHQRHCLQVREKSLGSLKIRLPEIFRAMLDYTHACSEAYQRLRSISRPLHPNGGPS